MKYSTVIFDLDGTLLNTLYDLGDSVNYALIKHGFDCISYEDTRRFVGNGVKNLIIRALPEGTDEVTVLAVLNTFKVHYSDNMDNKSAPYDGITELLQELKQNGITTAVLSNKFDAAVKRLCERYFAGLIDIAMGEREGFRRKPYPDSINAIISSIGCKKENAIYVGDADTDIMTAKNANIANASVTWGFRDKQLLLKSGAELIADTPQELREILL